MPRLIVPNKHGIEKEYNSQYNVNKGIKAKINCFVDTGTTSPIILKHFIQKYHLQILIEKNILLAKQTKDTLTFKGKCVLVLKIGDITKLVELLVSL